jgi:hypothetical protein
MIVKTSEILTKAKALIEDPKHWTRHCSARTDREEPVRSLSSRAASWCAVGAIERSCYDMYGYGYGYMTSHVSSAIELLRQASGTNVVSFNDNPNTAHQDVMRVFDAAIRAAEKEEKEWERKERNSR